MRRLLRIAALGVGAALLLAAAAVASSAVLDRPAKTVTLSTTVDAPKREVWDILTGFESYADWNPVVPEASGLPREGSRLRLVLELPGHEPETLDAAVLIAQPERKLRWQDRLLLPGVRDWEYEFVLEAVGGGRIVVAQRLRAEGILAPLADEQAAREALALLAAALRSRLSRRAGS